MSQPNPMKATAGYPPNSNVDQVEVQNGSDAAFQSGSTDWLKLLALVVLRALILRFDYSAVGLPNAFKSLATSVTGFFSSQSEEPALPSAPQNPIAVYSRPMVTVPNNVCQEPKARYENIQHRIIPAERRSNCH